MIYKLKIPCIPKAVQSFKYTKLGHKYQPDEVENRKAYITMMAAQQFKHAPLDGCIEIVYFYHVFSPLKSMTKAEKLHIANGGFIYKNTKPDVMDNLNKGVMDALNGICWVDDKMICGGKVTKVYGLNPGLYIAFRLIDKIIPLEKLKQEAVKES
jgi:Holliday junction resolvase RusA-like endonuclease